MKKKILLGFIVAFIAAQAIQPSKNKGNAFGPNDITTSVSVPADVMSVLKRSCFDCHSDYTSYPWYDHITPVNWWVAHHIDEGKRELNFSQFNNYTPKRKTKKLEEIAETVENGEMPLKSYLIMHGNAELTPSERILIINWVKASLNSSSQLSKP